MFKEHQTTLSAMVLSAIMITSFFAISFVQQTLALGNTTSANMTNVTNATPAGGGSAGMDESSGNETEGG
jgi:uncharacterized protein (UPF0333 family)